MNVTVFTQAEPAHPLMQQWATLGATTPFDGWEAFKAWDTLRPLGTEPFLLALADEQERLVAVAPWCIMRDGSGARRLTGIDGDDVWYHDLRILRPELSDAVAQSLIQTLRAHARSWDKLSLTLLRGPADAFRAGIRELGLTYEEPADWCPHLALAFQEDWEAYWASRPGSLQSAVKRSRKRLRTVPHRFYVAPPEAAEAHWEAIFEMQAKRMPGKRDWKAYHAAVLPFILAAARQGMLHPHALEIEGKLAAAILIIRVGDQAFHFVGSFDETFSPYSPGNLLTHWLLEQLHHQGLRSYDPGPGQYAWKESLTSNGAETVPIESVRLHAASPGNLRGAAEIAWSGLLIPRLKRNAALRQIRHALKTPMRRFQPLS